ncbi:RND transporter [Novosphingobium endophyticum]|uniref:RND transporter n=1 Tax=Novosphingobium endophyticum TaxID=1955250 RepID=A0A916X7P5_9SPHN|nr:efflux RND transporter periplasmic adaptor subunit [Novosphingobium endophyticum]GGC15785.1 RND transporter [Novosphingobium endophyticum]
MNDAAHHSPLDAFLGATPKRVRRHLVSIAVLAVAAIAAAVLFVRFVAGTESPYYFAPVMAGDIVPLVSGRGVVRSTREMTIRARFAGTVTSVPGPADGQVRSGQVLAVLDAASIEQALEIDRAAVAAAEAALESARITVQETASRLDRFESVWRRSGQRVPSLNELEAARADASRARQQEAAARARLGAARLRVGDEARRLSGAVVRSPIDGYVVARRVEPGRHVERGQPLFVLAPGGGQMTVTVPVTSAQAALLRPGSRGTLRIDGMPEETQTARLARVDTGRSGPIAVFVLEKPSGKVVPGMRANLEMELPKRSDVLLVPDAALEFSPEGSAGRERDRIYLLGDDGQPRRVYVSAGASDGKRTEISAQGVEPGARVIIGWRNPPADGDGSQ